MVWELEVTHDTWHVTPDTYTLYVTPDTLHVTQDLWCVSRDTQGVFVIVIVFKFQVPSSYGLGVKVLLRFWKILKGWLNSLIN